MPSNTDIPAPASDGSHSTPVDMNVNLEELSLEELKTLFEKYTKTEMEAFTDAMELDEKLKFLPPPPERQVLEEKFDAAKTKHSNYQRLSEMVKNLVASVMVKKKKQDFSNYVTDALQNSMLTGIPQIATAGNWPKKLIRTLVFCLCLFGFIYQSLTFMWIYWEYEVIVDVRVSNPMYVQKPAFTICISNGFKSDEFCKDPESEIVQKNYSFGCGPLYDEFVDEYYPDLCTCNPRVCDRYGGTLRDLEFVNDFGLLTNVPRKAIEKWLLTPEDIMPGCNEVKMREGEDDWLVCEDKYFVQVPCIFEGVAPPVCFTANSLIGRPNHTLEKVFTDAEIRLNVDFNEDLVPEYWKYNTLHISIHSPYTLENPFTNGFTMKAGYRYTFRMKKVVKKLLPHPYATDCRDYRSEWYARGGIGPTTLRECILECQKNLSLAKHGCLLRNIYIPTNETICSSYIIDPGFYKEAMACADKNCKPACEEEYYTVTQNVEELLDIECHKEDMGERAETGQITIRLDGMETTSYTYYPKFEDIETFSYLGGYVGMWLGISLVAVFDFIETVFLMLKYPLRRFRHYKHKKKRVDQIQKMQRHL